MSSTGLEVFDSSLQKTHLWLNDLVNELGLEDRQQAYLALRAVLHVLRDHLTIEEAAQLSAQLPLVLRGVYFEGWDPTGKPLEERDAASFLRRVYGELTPGFNDVDLDARQVVRAVFVVLGRHVSKGEVDDVRALLPKAVRDLWPPADTSSGD